MTTDVEAEIERTSRDLAIRRAKKNALMSSTMHAVSHSVGAYDDDTTKSINALLIRLQ